MSPNSGNPLGGALEPVLLLECEDEDFLPLLQSSKKEVWLGVGEVLALDADSSHKASLSLSKALVPLIPTDIKT